MDIKAIFTKHGLVLQKETYTCGAIALLNVLRLKGDMSYDELGLAKICNAKPGVGTSHEDLIMAAKKVGLQIYEEKRDASLDDVETHIANSVPVIVNLIHLYSGNGHYAVVTQADDKAFYFRDGTAGFVRIEKPEFAKIWRGDDGIERWFVAVA